MPDGEVHASNCTAWAWLAGARQARRRISFRLMTVWFPMP